MRTGSRICYTCVHCELRKDPPKRSGRKGLGVCRRRKRIVDIRADACGDYGEEEEGEEMLTACLWFICFLCLGWAATLVWVMFLLDRIGRLKESESCE